MLCFLHEFCRQMLTSVTFFIRLLESVLSVSVEKITAVSGLISLILLSHILLPYLKYIK